jgi:arginine/lysine/ornithine decarboxylase
MDAGADVCVVSVHKMGTGFEQGSVFHRQGGLVDPDQLSACADMLMTTSPNVMVYAALDGWRVQPRRPVTARRRSASSVSWSRAASSDSARASGLADQYSAASSAARGPPRKRIQPSAHRHSQPHGRAAARSRFPASAGRGTGAE